MSNHLVSIIIPCYNAEEWIAETIQSCLNQSYKNIEIIVVDDGSTDHSLSIIKSFSHQVKIIVGLNSGACHARNQGFELSNGEYVLFLDADDLILPDTIQALVKVTTSERDVITYCSWWYLSKQKNIWRTYKHSASPKKLDPISQELAGYYRPIGSLLFPRSLITSIGGWNENLSQFDDVDLKLRCLIHGAIFVPTNQGSFFYRLHNNESLSKQKSLKAFHSQIHVLKNAEKMMKQEGIFEKYRLTLAKSFANVARRASDYFPDLADEILLHAAQLAQGDSLETRKTWQHRIFSILIGENKKEKLARFLARHGIGRSERQAYIDL